MQYRDTPCRRGFPPTTTADTTAEPGCKRWRCAMACVCRMIRPAADRMDGLSCAAGATLSPWRAGREVANSLDGFHAAPSKRQLLSSSMIDKSPRNGSTAVSVAGNRHRDFTQKDTGGGTHTLCSPTPRVFVLSKYSFSAAPIRAQIYPVLSTTSGNSGGCSIPLFLAVPPHLLRPEYAFRIPGRAGPA